MSSSRRVHPLVRDLYKRVVLVSKDYPTTASGGTNADHVLAKWKQALRNPSNCPSCYDSTTNVVNLEAKGCEKELRKAVAKGRHYVNEMVGVIQLRKYRTMKKRYSQEEEEAVAVSHRNDKD